MKSQIKAYFEQLLNYLEAEKEEDLRLYQSFTHADKSEKRIAEGQSWYPVVLKSAEISTGGQFRLALERTKHLGEPHVFSSGANVALVGEETLHGVIVSVWDDSMRVAVDELPDWLEEGKFRVDILFDNQSYKEMEKALNLAANVTHPRSFFLRDVLLGREKPVFDKNFYPIQDPNINESQNQALNLSLSAQDIALIHGPPGTGKTTTLVRIICHILKSEDQVLLCAPSNVAVDVLCLKLSELGIKVVRLGNPARVQPELQSMTLDEQIMSHSEARTVKQLRKDAEEYFRLARKYKRNFGQPEREQRKLILTQARALKEEAIKTESYLIDKILSGAQVIAATLVGAASSYIQGKMFGTVFIDEAAQALEPACWIPILKAHRVIFAGDHQQLPPTVKAADPKAQGLTKTLFEKLMDYHPTSSLMLNLQYRMNATISGFSSKTFYGGKLSADSSVENRVLGQKNLILSQPLEFLDTAGCSLDEESQGHSFCNSGEIKVMFAHLLQLFEAMALHTNDFGSQTIALISPYKGQVNALKESLEADSNLEYFRKQILVNSIDGFQGQERDIVYISLVRSNLQGSIGFLSDIRRFNVAITRAKKKLVVVGDSATLSRLPFYESFLLYVEKNGQHKTAWEFI
jgi:superfamily I DNA and/or RNA helicase